MPARTFLKKIQNGLESHPYWSLMLLTVAALAPFLAKPFNIDDPCYLWSAKQILLNPADPYGFRVNWYGFSQSMWQVTQNPPLMSYYLALAACLFGWSEIGMHLACLVPAVAVVLGTYRLARPLCCWPGLAAAVTLFAPGFLVSATTVMCDVFMLAFWIWAVIYWTEGLRENNSWKCVVAGTLMALALLAKYNGACLVPLLLAYGYFARPSGRRRLWFLLIPAGAFLAYQYLTFRLYGQELFSAAAAYAQNQQDSYGISKTVAGFNALTFTGGCFAGVLFCAPFLWRRRTLAWIAASAGLLVTLFLAAGLMTRNYAWLNGGTRLAVEVQIIIWSAGGVCVLAMALMEVWQKWDAVSWLLALWVVGMLLFSAFFNWTVNVRSILPMAPAVAILMFRRLAQTRPKLPSGIKFSIIGCAILSLLVAQADFQEANLPRTATQSICAQYAGAPGRMWFEGHWGFQYYMQSAGAWPLDSDQLAFMPGDFLVVPEQNSNAKLIASRMVTLDKVFTLSGLPWLAALNINLGAGFYASRWGPLPFAFGSIPPEKYFVYLLGRPAVSPH